MNENLIKKWDDLDNGIKDNFKKKILLGVNDKILGRLKE